MILSVQLNDWQVVRVLGNGCFGQVLMVRNSKTRKVLAWKRFTTDRLLSANNLGNRTLELLQREIDIHQSVHHPHILPMLGYFANQSHVTLVLECVDQGDLFEYAATHCETVTQRLELFQQIYASILSAVSYLENLQIAHRDIKPENILLQSTTRNKTLTPKICDFGWSVYYFKAGSRQSTLCGTPEYVPPEVLATPRRYHAEFVDSWALGVLALEILTGETPFCVHHDVTDPSLVRPAIYNKIRSFQAFDQSAYLEWSRRTGMKSRVAVDPSCYVNMIDDFLQLAPASRLGASECLERYGQMLGEPRGHAQATPSVKQRRQVFQRSCVDSSAVVMPAKLFSF